jgi:collagen type VII alpha
MSGTLKLGATGGQILFSTSGTSGFSTPATGYGSLYYGSDKQLRLKDDVGSVTILSSTGLAGSNGTSGTSPGGGTSGTSGSSGSSGTSGADGATGSSGTSGSSGSSGSSGQSGTSGSSGTTGIGAVGATGNLAISFDNSALFNIGATAANNISIGTNSQYSLVFGSGNISCGVNTLQDYEGNDSVVIGDQTLDRLENGDNNIFVGARSGDNIASGDSNIGIGLATFSAVAQYATGGTGINSNIAIGDFSLRAIRSLSSNNIAIGLTSLDSLGAAGSTGNNNNIALGFAAGEVINNGSNNLILGATGGTAGMTGTIVLANGNASTEIVINNSALETGTYTSNRRIPIKIGGTTYYLMLST